MSTKLDALLTASQVSQRELARGTARSEALVSRIVNGGSGASQATITAILAFLTARLGRPVTYEELFGSPVEAATPEAEPAQEPTC